MFGDWHEITDSIKSYPSKNQRVILAVLRNGNEKHVLQGQWDGANFISFNGSTLWEDTYTVRYWMRMPDFPEGQKGILDERARLLRKQKRTASEERRLLELEDKILSFRTADREEDFEAMELIREAAALLKKEQA